MACDTKKVRAGAVTDLRDPMNKTDWNLLLALNWKLLHVSSWLVFPLALLVKENDQTDSEEMFVYLDKIFYDFNLILGHTVLK